MTARDFIMEAKVFNKRKLTELQHKLRVVLKCYTVTGFFLNENDNTFTFKKSYMIRGKRLDDQNECSGFYQAEDVGDNKLKIRIVVN